MCQGCRCFPASACSAPETTPTAWFPWSQLRPDQPQRSHLASETEVRSAQSALPATDTDRVDLCTPDRIHASRGSWYRSKSTTAHASSCIGRIRRWQESNSRECRESAASVSSSLCNECSPTRSNPLGNLLRRLLAAFASLATGGTSLTRRSVAKFTYKPRRRAGDAFEWAYIIRTTELSHRRLVPTSCNVPTHVFGGANFFLKFIAILFWRNYQNFFN